MAQGEASNIKTFTQDLWEEMWQRIPPSFTENQKLELQCMWDSSLRNTLLYHLDQNWGD